MLGFGYVVYSSSTPARYTTALLACAFCGYAAVMNRRDKRNFEALANTRDGESLCRFARSFDTRQTDTWVIRAAHQEIQRLLHAYVPHFPVRASDSLLNNLRLDADDVDDLVQDIATRCGRSLEKTESNPYYAKLHTVSDLVRFIHAQPRIVTV